MRNPTRKRDVRMDAILRAVRATFRRGILMGIEAARYSMGVELDQQEVPYLKMPELKNVKGIEGVEPFFLVDFLCYDAVPMIIRYAPITDPDEEHIKKYIDAAGYDRAVMVSLNPVKLEYRKIVLS